MCYETILIKMENYPCFSLLVISKCYICTRLGTLAQLVEQWTENPCVPGSIPGGTTRLNIEEY